MFTDRIKNRTGRTSSVKAFPRILQAALIALVLGMLEGRALAATFQICVMARVQTTDSSQTANGITEDYWTHANQAGGYNVVGRGFRVKVTQGAWEHTYDSDPTTGCFSFTRASSSGFGVRVYGFATDVNGNSVRIHDAQTITSSWYPGATYSAYWANQTLSSSTTNTYVVDGLIQDRWTTMAAAAFGLHRFHAGVSDATISIGFDEGDCDNSGSTHGSAEEYIESHNAHLFRVGRCSGTESDAREKMIVTHELGHAMLRLYYGYDGDDGPRNQSYSPPASITTDTPAQGSNCWNVSSYDMNSLEWNSQAFKEAFADFYSARVWNAKASRGTYTYREVAYDLEMWDNVNNVNTSGGFTSNWCGSTANGVSTKGDWLRFFWDWFVAPCGEQPTELDMMNLYRAVRENNRTGAFSLCADNIQDGCSRANYDNATLYAIENSISGLSSCEKDFAEEAADWDNLG